MPLWIVEGYAAIKMRQAVDEVTVAAKEMPIT